ncbi:MAG: transposase [Halobacteriovoraceae bacterium]|nr:transposase [Halobacteriovoraceae bacterium]
MNQKTVKIRKSYSKEFKTQAIELAKELGAKKAVEKLDIKNFQTLAAWIRYSKKMDEDEEFHTMKQLKVEIKKLKKELADER